MKFNKFLTKDIRAWFKSNGFECGCRLGRFMAYEYTENYVQVPYIYDDNDDIDFMAFLRNLRLKYDFDAITLSILHELGHFETIGDFTETEIQKDGIIKNNLYRHYLDNTSLNFAYWNTKLEYAANEWAVWYANTRPNKVQILEEIIEKYLTIY